MQRVKFNDGPARDAIKRAMAALADPQPLYERIGDHLVRQRRERFIKGVGADGKAWAPKSEATLERYRRMGYGELTRPLIGPGQALSRQIKMFVSKDGVVVGSALAYSGVMQEGAAKGAFGTDRRGNPLPWGKIPARPWIDLGNDEGRTIIEIVDEYLAASLKGG